MKKDDSFFLENTSPEHDQRIMDSVQENLIRNRRSYEDKKPNWFSAWSLMGMGLSTAVFAGVLTLLLTTRNRENGSELFAFAELDLTSEEIEFLSTDIELIENIEMLELMEEDV